MDAKSLNKSSCRGGYSQDFKISIPVFNTKGKTTFEMKICNPANITVN